MTFSKFSSDLTLAVEGARGPPTGGKKNLFQYDLILKLVSGFGEHKNAKTIQTIYKQNKTYPTTKRGRPSPATDSKKKTN